MAGMGLSLIQCSGGDDAARSEKPMGDAMALDTGEPDDGGSFSDPYDGASGCDGGVQTGPRSCEIRMPVSGGLTGILSGADGYDCTSRYSAPPSVPTGFGVTLKEQQPGVDVAILFVPSGRIVPGQTGTMSDVAVAIDVFNHDGGSPSWTTPSTCRLEITSNVCAPGASIDNLYVVSGTGHCPDVAAPYGMNTEVPVTVGDFYFASWFQSELSTADR